MSIKTVTLILAPSGTNSDDPSAIPTRNEITTDARIYIKKTRFVNSLPNTRTLTTTIVRVTRLSFDPSMVKAIRYNNGYKDVTSLVKSVEINKYIDFILDENSKWN